ncbi:Siderophore biosynthesis non-ribosomal peptide synthetase [Pseudomonas chlororaphis subsp. piscium]|uniref:non-ribosomal peptide synthetase n=3 Tax=Pseudomonas chlororaphis TaxID=587753 RepID=UPI00087C027C|nr:non-ribosomal peptide synthetase [Pseudomonas chlororaphis]AZC31801.1 Siderophore biosynthesis non-ribosomal peptide synthetase [Pseudomonas chlororaphis subsp. piscium]SDS82115.1 amino acid adenylation domain-containing protein [Pseudomonas chlororaphis]
MNIERLMTDLVDAGATLCRNGDMLQVKAPPGALNSELVERLRQAKETLLQMLDDNTPHAVPLPSPGEGGNTCALSPGQASLVLATRLGDPAMYNEQAAIELAGPVNAQVIEGAFAMLARKHDILRTVFVDGDPMQQTVLPTPVVQFAVTAVDNDNSLRALAADIAKLPFAPQQPLWRVDLFSTFERPAVLVLTIHHAIFDRWSMGVLIRDLNTYLDAPVPEEAPLPHLNYRDFAAWQRRWMNTSDYTSQLDSWVEMLADIDEVPTIRSDYTRPAVRSRHGGTERIAIPADCITAASTFARERNTTLFTTLFSVFALLLQRYTGEARTLTLTPAANRPFQAAEDIAGYFVNLVPLVADVRDNDNFTSFVERMRGVTARSFAHQGVPIESIAERLRSRGGPPLSQLAQTVFAFQNVQLPTVHIAGGRAKPFDLDSPFARFDLYLSIENDERGTFAVWQYSTDLFDASTICRLGVHYVALLSAALASPETDVRMLPVLSDTEQAQLLYGFNATQSDFPQDALIHQLFEAQAQRSPTATALVFGQQTLSYGELNRRANRLAHHLIALGVRPDDRVALCVERSPEMVVGLLAILKAGGAYVPLDPDYPAERRAYMLADAAPVALLTQRSLIDESGPTLPTVLLDVQNPAIEELADSNPDAGAMGLTARHLAYVIYTSGSTGQPKGVMVEHLNVNRLVINNTYADIGPNDCVAHCANIAFDASTWEIWSALLNGGRLYLISQSVLLDPQRFRDALIHGQVTALWLTAGLFNQYVDGLIPVFGQLRYLLVGGDVLDARKIGQLLAAESQPEHLLNGYGPTETTTFAATHAITAPLDVTRSIPIGRPIANTRIYILDSHGQPAPLGVAGELHIAGAGVARGYLNRPELTAERFINDPFCADPHARMYKTGDLGRWLPDGTIEYLGRNDFQVKLRGFRIELGEIEAALARCEGVRDAVVIPREDVPGDKRLVAYVLPQTGVEIAPAELRQQLARQLAEYMLPGAFVTLDTFPLTPNGKLDRQALPVPDLTALATRGYQAPVGEMETTLAQIWQDLLGLARVGRYDNFFELGGHSLLGVSLIERLRELGLTLAVRTVFASPALADMAQAISAHQDHASAFVVPDNLIPMGCSAITPDMLPLVTLTQDEIDVIVGAVPGGAANVQDIYPLAPLQEGILFHHLLQQRGDAYLLRSLMAFDSRARLDAFLCALQQVINRHDILRTAACWQGLAQPVQVVWRQAHLHVETFYPIQPGDVPAQLAAHTDPRRRRLELNRAPLFALDIAQDPTQDEWLLALSFHHLVGDHLTLEQIVSEVTEVLQGRGEALPAALPYRNFIAQTRSVPDAVHETYFRERLADVDEPTAPFGRLEVQGDGQAVTEAQLPLPAELAQAIRSQARRLGVSPGVLFHVAWAQVLAQTSGRDDVVFGTVLLGRLQGYAGAERAMGLFINTLPLRIALAGRGVQDVVLATYRELMALLEHEQAPLALAQRCSGVALPLPLFSALLNYRHSVAGGSDMNWEGIRLLSSEERTNYPFTVSVDDLGEGFSLTAQTVEGVDPARMAAYLATAITGLVDALANEPERAALSLPVVPPEERQQLLYGFNATQSDFPQDALIHQLFEAQAQRNPTATALVFEQQTLSYGELNRRANRLAHHLIALGVRPDDRVALCVERSPEMVVGLLAILKAGGAYVPLDPDYPAERRAYMLADAAPVALLTQRSLIDESGPTLPTVLLDVQNPAIEELADSNPDAGAMGLTARHLAYVIYTSGSTGQPKGVMVEHLNVNRLVINNTYADIGPNDCVAHCANIAFDASTWEIWSALLNGGRLYLISQSVLLDPQRFRDALIHGQVTALWLTAGLFNQYVDGLIPVFGQLRYLLVGGDVLDARKIGQLLAAESQPEHLLNGYGPTETTTFAATHAITAPLDVTRSIPIGRPIANTRIYILDSHGQPAPLGVAGELHIAGAGVARGYLNRPELTAERFINDPFCADPHARMYKTGDLGRWLPDGTIEYLGRNDFQVKLRGFRIELGEIEAALARCEGVRDAVVIPREDVPGDKRLVAYVLPQTGVEIAPAELRQQLARQLAEYMLPGAFVTLDTFPLTPNGKLDRQALPVPDLTALATRGYQAPVGEMETTLAQIWQDLLGLARVGRYDNFFELGGHSLLGVSLIERLRELGLTLAVRTVFASPALADMAQAISAHQDHASAFVVPDNLIPMGCSAITPDMLPLVTLTQDEIDVIVGAVPGGAANVQDIYPLAPLQEGILFHHLLQQRGDAYLLRSLMAFDSRARLDAFLCALQQVINRHDILRTAACWQGLAQPVQVVWRQAHLHVETFYPIQPGDVPAQLAAHTDPRRRRLELNRAPLFALDIAQDPTQDEWLLALSFHHLVGDHLTLEQIVSEVTEVLQGRGEALPAALPYRNFIAQTRSVPDAVHETYFRERLADVDEPTAPFGRLEVQGDGQAVTEAQLPLPAELAQAIRSQARRLGVSPGVLFHVAWAQVLAQTSGRDDVVFGTVLLGRLQGYAGAERAMGLFINTLPLRIALAGRGVQDVVLATYRELMALLEHEQAPLALAQRCSGVALPLPLFSALLNYRHSVAGGSDMNWEGIRLLSSEERTNYPFTVSVDDLGEGFSLTAQTVEGVDPARMAAYLATAITGLVDALANEPERAALSLSVLPPEEAQRLIYDWNATPPAGDGYLLHTGIERHATLSPLAPAIIGVEGSMNYGELAAETRRIAGAIAAADAHRVPVAVLLPRSVCAIAAYSGVMLAGCAYVPVDPAMPPERMRDLLVIVDYVLTTRELAASIDGVCARVILIDQTADAMLPAVVPDDLAYVMFTSGSTGKPKGVMVSHRAASLTIEAILRLYRIGPSDRLLCVSSAGFDLSVFDFFGAFAAGAAVVLAPESADVEPCVWLDMMEREQATVWESVPAVMELLLLECQQSGRKLPPSLKLVMLSGDRVPINLPTRIREASTSDLHVIALGGATEAAIWSCYYDTSHLKPDAIFVPYGRHLPGQRLYVLSSSLQALPIGVPGDLWIAGTGVARGYLAQPDLTAYRFLDDPYKPGEQMYRTGDSARVLTDGNLEFLGRVDDQVKIGGFRIELGEIEAALAAAPGVERGVVMIAEHCERQTIAAYVVPLADRVLNIPAIREALALRLPPYMLPASIMSLDRVPLTSNGKVDRKALPAPDLSALVTRHYEAPVGETETTLAQIWQDLLGLARVGRYDNFFELGGHSLLGVSLIERLRELGLTLAVRTVFSSPALADMAQAISAHQDHASAFVVPDNLIPVGCSAITPDMLPLVTLTEDEIDVIVGAVPGGAANVQDIYPLAPLQEGILFHHLLQQRGDAYLLRSLMAFDSRARLDAFLCALQQVINRHDILRTAACWQGLAQPVQVVWRQAHLHIETFYPIQPGDVPAQLAAHTDPRRRRLELNRAPLFALDIAQDPTQDEWLLALSFHHLVGDHLTLEQIVSEVTEVLQGRGEALPAALPYRNFIAQTRSVPDAVHETYFRERLADVDEPTAPFGRLEVQGDGQAVTEAQLPLPAELAQAIRSQARRLGVSPGVLFHVAWAQVLAQTSGRDDVVFGTVLLGRLQGYAGAERAMGLFINTLPLRIALAGRGVQDVVLATYRELMALLEHEQAPLALAQRCSGVALPLPLFSALLNYRHSVAGGSDMNWEGIRLLSSEERTNYPFTVSVDDLGEGFSLTAQTVEGVDPARMAAYLATAITGLVDALANEPERAALSLPVVPPEERQQLLYGFNATQSDFPQDALIHQLFEAQAQRNPTATALVFEQQTLSYGELNRRANRLAHHLIALGVRPDDRVALCVERSPEMVVGLLAILKAGGAYVPLDPDYPAERRAYMLADAAPVALLTQRSLIDESGPTLPTVLLDVQNPAIEELADSNPDAGAMGLTARHLAYVIYTSGSTGQPKGVMVEHRNVTRLLAATQVDFQFDDNDVLTLFHSFAFDFSVWELWAALSYGGRLVIVSTACARSPLDFYALLCREQVTVLNQTPSAFRQLIPAQDATPHALRCIIFGGEALEFPILAPWVARNATQQTRLVNMYGITEITIHATYRELTDADIAAGHGSLIGKPLPDLRAYLLDQHGQPTPLGVAGELHIAGAGVARGYLNRPELTAERFIDDPFCADPHARMYKTGDLGRWLPDGTIEYLGRNDFQVKLRGFRIELGEIEAALARCEGVRDAVVIPREDVPGDKRLVAYVLPQTGVEIAPAELRQQLARQLAEYMLPSAFVTLEAFPLTPNGKLDRQALPAPDLTAVATRGYQAPAGEMETTLAQIWQDLLGLARVGRNDHFFELGGDSLLMLRVCSRAGQVFGLDQGMAARLLMAMTIGEQARLVNASDEDVITQVGALFALSTPSDAPPLFFAPGAGGHVPYLHALAGELAGTFRVWGMHLTGADEVTDDTTRVEAIASELIVDIRRVQPHGPYRLGGHSFGGLIAFEIARRLASQDEQVTLLAVVDSIPPGQTEQQTTMKRSWPNSRWAAEIGNSFAQLTGADLAFEESEFHRLDDVRQVELLHTRLVAAGAVPEELELSEFANRVRAFIAHSLADYHLTTLYPGPMSLIVANDDKDGIDRDELINGWRKAVAGDIAVIRLPGDHIGIMRYPFVRRLTEVLRNLQQQPTGDNAIRVVSAQKDQGE